MIFWPRLEQFNISPREGQKHKIGIFRDPVKYFIRKSINDIFTGPLKGFLHIFPDKGLHFAAV